METSSEFETRTERFQKALRARSIDVALLLEPRDQFYLTGIGVKGAVVVPADDAPVHLVQLNIGRAREDSAIDDVRSSVGTRTIIDVITTIPDEAGLTIGVEKDVLPIQTYEKLQRHFRRRQYSSTSVPQYSVFADESRNRNSSE